ncbi:MAG: NADH-quinone oxidoreductase subunit J [Euryarchaeota archaeon]|nr:NADH-quinone oxidoreductase subunit J [Euryarchaeota archaeon]
MAELGVVLDWVGFWTLTLVTLGAAVLAVVTPRLVHSAMWLAVVLFGVAGFFLFLGSEFLAGIQVLIYIGAILTLILFSIMFTAEEEEEVAP